MRSLVPLALAALLQRSGVANALATLSVNTTSGRAYGLVNGSAPDVAQFLGIPYAEAPVGKLRFRPPQRKRPVPGGIIDATKPAGLCPQYHEDKARYPSVYTYDAPWLQPWGNWTEDCLNLNIWAPYNPIANSNSTMQTADLLPVIIWIFGGGFYEGGLDTEAMDPSQWIQRTRSHIVVAMNARVNIFGFPNSRGLAEEGANLNVGLLDQRSAIEWVRDNIAFFGGDASRMLLWGQSSGAASTDYYNYAYPEDPIVGGFIQHSGSVFATGESKDVQMLNFSSVAAGVGCAGLTAREELSCMQNASAVDIVSFWQEYNLGHEDGQLSFTTVVDGVTKFADYTARARAGNYSKLPAIIGTNYNEMASLIDWPGVAGPNLTDLRIQTLGHQQCPANYNTMVRYKTNSTTFRYLNDASFPNISPRPWEGAYHTSELPLLFGTFTQYGWAENSIPSVLEYATAAKWQDFYVAFARDPRNALPDAGWPAWRPDGSALIWNPKDGNGTTVAVSRLVGAEELVAPCEGIAWSIQTP
ncbi:hypothetical protein BDW74DRAFT_172000 [Aspergillus multicolor]|uniref:uncharacterized protein n=1 Tax=Aspergillus multicolor TaxID=41759 RepID=UPI003CCDDF10